MIKQFYIKQVNFALSFACPQFKCQTVLFDLEIGPFQVLPLQVRVDLGDMALKGVLQIPQSFIIRGASSVEMQLVYSTALAERPRIIVLFLCVKERF